MGQNGKKDSKEEPSPQARKGDAARAERLRAALRENLKRRKSQARGRSAKPAGPPHDSAGILPDKTKE